MPYLENTHRKNETLRFSEDDADWQGLGENVVLEGCELLLDLPAEEFVLSAGTRLVGCTIRAVRTFARTAWSAAWIEGCRFEGHFDDSDFGHAPWFDEPNLGGMKDCDFQNAQLSYCQFLSTDVRTLKLPAWPCFTLADPGALRNIDLTLAPHDWGSFFGAALDGPDELTAASLRAEDVIEGHGGSLSELRAFIVATFPGSVL